MRLFTWLEPFTVVEAGKGSFWKFVGRTLFVSMTSKSCSSYGALPLRPKVKTGLIKHISLPQQLAHYFSCSSVPNRKYMKRLRLKEGGFLEGDVEEASGRINQVQENVHNGSWFKDYFVLTTDTTRLKCADLG